MGRAAWARGARGTGFRSPWQGSADSREGWQAVPPRGKTTRRRRFWLQPCLAPIRSSPAAAASWEPPPRVHTSPHKQGKRLEEAPVSSGCRRAGEEAQSSGPHSPGIPPPPGSVLLALGVISLAPLRRREERAGWRRRLAPVPVRPTRKPAAAPCAAAPNDLNTRERASGGPREGCAQGALVSDPREANWGISSARKVRVSAGARKVLVKHFAKLQKGSQELRTV